jgi:HlyD family secretion protein
MSDIRRWMIALITVVVLVWGGGNWLRSRAAPEKEPQNAGTPATPPPAGSPAARAPAQPGGDGTPVRLTGIIRPTTEAALAPRQGGRIVAVLVAVGQRVRRHQLLVRLDDTDARAQVERAMAGVTAAAAQLEKARVGERLRAQEVERRIQAAQRGLEQARNQLARAEAGARLQRSTGSAEVERAQAGVDAARSALARARQGARPEELRQAEVGVRQAERTVSLAEAALADAQFLYEKGGLPRVRLDEARENHLKAQDGLVRAQAQLSLAKQGATPEEVAAAEAQVRAAEAGLAAARAAAEREELEQAELASAQVAVRQAEDGLRAAEAGRSELDVARAELNAARAALTEAHAAAELARNQQAATLLVAPADGLVSRLDARIGELAAPGAPLVQLSGTRGLYVECAVPARLVGVVQAGLSATVETDVLPGTVLRGTVRWVAAVPGPDGRSHTLHVALDDPPAAVPPGARARVSILPQAVREGHRAAAGSPGH